MKIHIHAGLSWEVLLPTHGYHEQACLCCHPGKPLPACHTLHTPLVHCGATPVQMQSTINSELYWTKRLALECFMTCLRYARGPICPRCCSHTHGQSHS